MIGQKKENRDGGKPSKQAIEEADSSIHTLQTVAVYGSKYFPKSVV